MVLSTATLSNCYTPLPLPRPLPPSSPSEVVAGGGGSDREGKSPRDGDRGERSLRRIHLSRSVLSSSDGSCLVELGQTKILCSVRGPRATGSSSLAAGGGPGIIHDDGTLNVEVRYAPQFGTNPETAAVGSHSAVDAPSHGGGGGGNHSSQMTEEAELSSRLSDALTPAVRLDDLPKSAVDVLCVVLQSDGGILPACAAAASVALADAGVGMNDLVGCCAVAAVIPAKRGGGGGDSEEEKKKKGEGGGRQKRPLVLLADPTESELLDAAGTVTVAMLPGFREVTAWEQTGRLPPDVSGAALEVCRDGCATMHKFMRNCLAGGGAGGGGEQGGEAAAGDSGAKKEKR